MRKTMRMLLVVLALIMTLALVACQKPVEIQTQNEDGTLTVAGVLIEQVVTTAARLLEAAVLVYGAWALDKLGKNKGTENLALANQELRRIVRQTVRELNQTVVTNLKEKSPNGKLTEKQIFELNEELLDLVRAKAGEATISIIAAAGADVDALITGQCEAYLDTLKSKN